MYAIVDIETCGGKYTYPNGRIIEICILVHDGLQIVEKFSTLINPQCRIMPIFTSITGITNQMLYDAPTFEDVAKDILHLTKNNIFVAHNVSFDYNFIQAEMNALGIVFDREKLCTVKLSRKIIKNLPSYSLGKLCASLNIPLENRHRAEGDAQATAKLLDYLFMLENAK